MNMDNEEIFARIERVRHLISVDDKNPNCELDIIERKKELAILEKLVNKP